MKKPWPETVIELITTEGRDLSKINFTMSEDNVTQASRIQTAQQLARLPH